MHIFEKDGERRTCTYLRKGIERSVFIWKKERKNKREYLLFRKLLHYALYHVNIVILTYFNMMTSLKPKLFDNLTLLWIICLIFIL